MESFVSKLHKVNVNYVTKVQTIHDAHSNTNCMHSWNEINTLRRLSRAGRSRTHYAAPSACRWVYRASSATGHQPIPQSNVRTARTWNEICLKHAKRRVGNKTSPRFDVSYRIVLSGYFVRWTSFWHHYASRSVPSTLLRHLCGRPPSWPHYVSVCPSVQYEFLTQKKTNLAWTFSCAEVMSTVHIFC